MRNSIWSLHSIASMALAIMVGMLSSSCDRGPEVIPEYGWFDFVIQDLDTTENEISLSFLNEDEAGQSGFITVLDGHFVDGNGKKMRFFGTNLTFSSCFPDKDQATLIAARLKKMGMNVVRFHHMDMRAAPAGIWDDSMEKFDPVQLDKLDWLIYQLKQHGVYTNINLHVSRTYPGLRTTVSQFNFGKSLDHFYRPYIDFQKTYARDLLTHVNPYTGKNYLEEPAVAFIEINNENSLLSNWEILPQLEGDLRVSLRKQWNDWYKATGRSLSPPDIFRIIERYDSGTTPEEKEMLWAFLLETEMAYAGELIGFVRDGLGAQSLIADSQASYSGIAGVYREAEYSDFIDMHAYWEHPRFPNESWSRTDWLIRNSSMVSDKNAGTLARFGQHRVKGMPITISEYDHPAPNYYCAEMYPMLNAVASFQDWDGIYHFTFNEPWDQGRISGFFSSSGHPLKQIFIPIGSIIFRMEAVKPGTRYVRLHLSEDALLDELVESGHLLRLHGSNMNHIWERAGAPKALPLMYPMELDISSAGTGLSESIQEPGGPWISETNELVWNNLDSAESVFTINSESVKAVVGYVSGRTYTLGNLSIVVDSTEFRWAAIVMASLDGKPVEKASDLLLIAAGRVENTNMGWNEDHTTVGSEWGVSPTRAEGIPAWLYMENAERFEVYALDASGSRSEEIRVKKAKNQQSFVIGAQYKTLWYLLKRDE